MHFRNFSSASKHCLFFFTFLVVYFETYGCQMNVNDTEIAWSILQKGGYQRTAELSEVPFSPCNYGIFTKECFSLILNYVTFLTGGRGAARHLLHKVGIRLR